jgi:tRNA (guanine37-N1)-methyltransferase
MRFDLVTIFPDFFRGPLEHGILRRAQDAGLAEVRVHDLRQFTHDRHRTVDDRPFGGGEGMVLKPEPLFEAVEHLLGPGQAPSLQPLVPVVLLSASGKLFRQADARRFAERDRIIFLCGRYEGVDERVAEHLATEELSIGDFVLSGGELPAALIVDAVTRLLPGALGNEDSAANESFSGSGELSVATSAEVVSRQRSAFRQPLPPSPQPLVPGPGLLDFPHYTRPADFRGWRVPDVLLSGNHAEVRRWRRKMALTKTLRNRPDLLAAFALTAEDSDLIRELQSESESADPRG